MTSHVDEDIAAVIREQTFGTRCTWRQTAGQHTNEILYGNFITTVVHLMHNSIIYHHNSAANE